MVIFIHLTMKATLLILSVLLNDCFKLEIPIANYLSWTIKVENHCSEKQILDMSLR